LNRPPSEKRQSLWKNIYLPVLFFFAPCKFLRDREGHNQWQLDLRNVRRILATFSSILSLPLADVIGDGYSLVHKSLLNVLGHCPIHVFRAIEVPFEKSAKLLQNFSPSVLSFRVDVGPLPPLQHRLHFLLNHDVHYKFPVPRKTCLNSPLQNQACVICDYIFRNVCLSLL